MLSMQANYVTKTGEPSSFLFTADADGHPVDILNFQVGPHKEVGTNGLRDVDVLRAVQQRLFYFQNAFPSETNEQACSHVSCALNLLENRIKTREFAGVYGTSAPEIGPA